MPLAAGTERPPGAGLAFLLAARRVRDHLGQRHRFEHVVRVARFAEQLARRHGEDTARARLAGLYHDLARLYSAEELLAQCSERGVPIGTFERENPIVLHAPLGAELARSGFGVQDEAILSAIRKHTLGAAQMSRLDTIVFLADGLEPGRTYPQRAEYAALAFQDLAAGMRCLLESTIGYLRARNLTIAPQTLAAAASFGASVSGNNCEKTLT